MKITSIHIGMKVRHPHHGEGIIKGIAEHTVDIQFEDSKRIVDPQASDLIASGTNAAVTNLEMPIHVLIDQVVGSVLREMGVEKTDIIVQKLAQRWQGGKMLLHPADVTLQAKEIPLETFFHKIVMMRNNLRTLEQKINSSETLTAAEKFDCHQYITRCYGSMTTFNLLFKDKEDYF